MEPFKFLLCTMLTQHNALIWNGIEFRIAISLSMFKVQKMSDWIVRRYYGQDHSNITKRCFRYLRDIRKTSDIWKQGIYILYMGNIYSIFKVGQYRTEKCLTWRNSSTSLIRGVICGGVNRPAVWEVWCRATWAAWK